jgi:mutator protein MutT
MSDVRRTLLFLQKDDELLLAMKKRGFGAGRWNGVGGKLDEGETVEQATIRECQEEIGVTPITFHKVGELDFYGGSTEEAWNMFVHAYMCTEWEGEPVETEEMAPKWYKISDLPYKDMWADDIYWLPKVLSGESVKATFTFNEKDEITGSTVETVAPYV